MRKGSSSCIESVRGAESEQIRHSRSVDVRKAEETARKVRRIVIRPEQAAELTIEHVLHLLSEISQILINNSGKGFVSVKVT